MYTEEFYTDYFEGLARNLSDIGHTDRHEHFFFNNETGNGLDELKKAVGGRLNLPALVLDEQELEDDGSGAGGKVSIIGGFTVLDKFDPQDFKSLRLARIRAQRIARKLVARMKRDSRANFDEESPLLLANAIQLGEIKQYPTPVILNQLAGWSVEFKWIMPFDINFGAGDFY